MKSLEDYLYGLGLRDEQALQFLQEVQQERILAKGELFLSEGEICKYWFFIRKGLLRFYYLKEGQEFIRQFFFEGALLTEFVSSERQIPSLLNIDAVEETVLTLVPRDLLYQLFNRDHQMGSFHRAALSEALFHASNRLASIFLETPEERYRQLMAERPKVMQRIPQYMIASYCGVTPEGLSRIKRRITRSKKRS